MEESTLAFEVLNEHFVPLFEGAGRRASLSEGVRALMDAHHDDFVTAFEREGVEPSHGHAGDTHPPTHDRLRALAASPVTASVPSDPRPSVSLLTGERSWLDAAEASLLITPLPLASWEEVVRDGMRSAEIQSARLNLAIDLTLTDGSAVRISSTVDSAPDLEQEVALELRALLGARYADDEASRTP